MRKSYYAIPFLAAGTVASGLTLTALTTPAPASATPGLFAPLPLEYPWCELDLYCYDSDIDIALNPHRDKYGSPTDDGD